MLIVALPLSPCAFVSSACQHETPVAVDVAPAVESCAIPERGCCAYHSGPAQENSLPDPGQQPCKAECCRLSPFVPPVAKVAFDVQPLALAVALPRPPAIYASPFEAPSLPLAARPPLQILHCQWRL